MSGHITSPAEWAQMVSLSVSLYAACSAPYFLLVDAEVWAWPRPLVAVVEGARPVVWDASRSEAVWPLLRGWSNTKCDVREIPGDVRELAAEARVYVRLSLRDAVVSAAALLMLLTASEATR